MPHPDDQPIRHPTARHYPYLASAGEGSNSVARPPPMYYPGETERARRAARQVEATGAAGGAAQSTNVASSRTAGVEWAWHPTADAGWKRWTRVCLWWRVLARNEKEELWGGWPVEFGGVKRAAGDGRRGGDEESNISRTLSGRSTGADSG